MPPQPIVGLRRLLFGALGTRAACQASLIRTAMRYLEGKHAHDCDLMAIRTAT
jgi:hypothetical protein